MLRRIKLGHGLLGTLTVGAGVSLAVLAGMGRAADETKPVAPPEAKLISVYKVTKIRVVPAEVNFSQPSEYQKVIVLGDIGASHEIDLTRTAKFTADGDCAKLGSDGYLHPVKDGSAKVTVSAAGLTAELPVTVH